MKLYKLIKTNNWLSVEKTFLFLYPDQKENIDSYKIIFDSLQLTHPIESEISIILESYPCDNANGFYVDVSGRKEINTLEITNSLAIEFVPWREWLGMTIDPKTKKEFNELEIICHCLSEMTYFSFDEKDIQQQLATLKELANEYKNMTNEEKEKKTVSVDKLLNDFNIN